MSADGGGCLALLEVSFRLPDVLRSTHRPRLPQRPTCHLYIFSAGAGGLRLRVQVGDATGVRAFPKAEGFIRRPVRFDYLGPTASLQLEFHSLGERLVAAPADWPIHADLGLTRAKKWPFTCVLRGRGAAGQSAEGLLLAGVPKMFGAFPLAAADLKRERLRKRLELLAK